MSKLNAGWQGWLGAALVGVLLVACGGSGRPTVSGVAQLNGPVLGLYGHPDAGPPALDPTRIRMILWVRTDAIGDAVLAMDQLRILGPSGSVPKTPRRNSAAAARIPSGR